MNHSQSKAIFAISIIITLCLSACHSSKEAQSTGQGHLGQEHTTALTTEQKVVKMVDAVESWSDISLPLKCKIRQPKKISISGRASMIRGREINISLKMLGFEVAGLYADRDSLIVYERLNKTMIVEPMSKIEATTGMTLSNLQDVLTGRICYPGEQLDADNVLSLFKLENNAFDLVLLPKSKAPWNYNLVGTETPQLKSLTISIPGKIEATCNYEQFTPPITGFCRSATVTAKAGRHTLDATLEWYLDKAKVDNGLKPHRPSFKGFRRISFTQLIKLLGGI